MNIALVFIFMALISCKGSPQTSETAASEVQKQENHDEHQETDEHVQSEHLTVNLSTLKQMNIQSSPLQGPPPWRVPLGTAISSGRDTFVYYKEKTETFSRLPVTISRVDQKHEWIQSKKLKTQDQIVTKGAKFLRIIELDAAAGDEAGHVH